MPRMNSVIERWVQTCRHELLDRTSTWNQAHPLHALRQFEHFYNEHRRDRPAGARSAKGPQPDGVVGATGGKGVAVRAERYRPASAR